MLEIPGEEIPPRDPFVPILVKNYDKKEGMDTHLWFSKAQNDWYGVTNDWGGCFTFAAPCGKGEAFRV
ncbi:MAG: hypothetical protein LUC50_01300 [Ruminococcus sp.]|nr:hypothetical protein [Ruminococcus sp.]